MAEDRRDLLVRTKAFALQVIALVESLPRGGSTSVIGRQLLRSATSVGANYRAARRAKSTPDFVAKMSIVEEEADECGYWLELLAESKLIPYDRLRDLLAESDELVAITVASINTARARNQKKP